MLTTYTKERGLEPFRVFERGAKEKTVVQHHIFDLKQTIEPGGRETKRKYVPRKLDLDVGGRVIRTDAALEDEKRIFAQSAFLDGWNHEAQKGRAHARAGVLEV